MNHLLDIYSEDSENFNFSELVLFTSTFYMDNVEGDVRADLCIQMLEMAEKLGLKVVIMDGGSSERFIQSVQTYKNTVLLSEKNEFTHRPSMGESRRYSAEKALVSYPEAKYFLYMAPEKIGMITPQNLSKLMLPLKNEQSTVSVGFREDISSMPSQQAMVETRAEKRAMQILQDKTMKPIDQFKKTEGGIYERDESILDLWFGVSMWSRAGLEKYYLPFEGKKWDADIVPQMIAHDDGAHVANIPVDFQYPNTQTHLEQNTESAFYNQKRRSQYRYILKEIKKRFHNSFTI